MPSTGTGTTRSGPRRVNGESAISSQPLKYVHGLGFDEPLAREDGTGASTFYHADGLGSVVKSTNGVGTIVHEYRYDAWGRIEVGASDVGHSFTGREWDPETGLYYYRARFYDAQAGRFLSEDPIGLDGGLNFYSYVRNRVTNHTDPLGLLPVQDCPGGSKNPYNPDERLPGAALRCRDSEYVLCATPPTGVRRRSDSSTARRCTRSITYGKCATTRSQIAVSARASRVPHSSILRVNP